MDHNIHHTKFHHFLDNSLNEQQRSAVIPPRGIFLVCAGAGSGKTRVITARITNLILAEKVEPGSIIALTFTNKAGNEMKERMASFLGNETNLPFVGTFHSYCLRLLKSYSYLHKRPNFSIMDEDDQEKIIRSLIQKYGLQKKVTPRTILSAISRLKNGSCDGRVNLSGISDPIMVQMYSSYEAEKAKANCFDFDDLLLETLILFKNNPDFRSRYQEQIRHLLVDEYQDTNKVQHALLSAVSLNLHSKFALDSLCVVGDEDQSIYSWRGATVTNILNFKHEFDQVHSITIEQNYRSANAILDVAHQIISHNQQRNPKRLWSTKSGHDRVRILDCSSSFQEGEVVVAYAKTLLSHHSKISFATLYRSHYQSRALEEALVRSSIPYRIIGGIRFYDRQEVKDILAYLRLVLNPFDRLALLRCINAPSRGLGEKFQDLFIETWDNNPALPFQGIAALLLNQSHMTTIKANALKSFIDLFKGISSSSLAQEVVEHFINSTNYYLYLKNSFEQEESRSKIENLKELLAALSLMAERGILSIESFLEEVSLVQDYKNSSPDDSIVCLMTLHSAKGLEFEDVVITGLEEGVLPSSHSLYNSELLEEERRLCYVGITRAKERLLITHTKYRHTWGQATVQRISRFVNELSGDIVSRIDANSWSARRLEIFFEGWLTQKTPKIQSNTDSIFSHVQSEPNEIQWSIGQKVRHASFGLGTIKKTETKDNKIFYLTVEFPIGIRKVSSNFITT
ncbi:MAG TPA: UvrD-helicase domain-containing protein [Candidatus Babeliaceae bacterium]|nr:UvrD-helicase domain-containing protein [Candidatus Babeliaceae bacterium]